MDAFHAMAGLNNNFRHYVLANVIIPKLKECAHNITDPMLINSIEKIGLQFEREIYNKATSKDDYVYEIQNQFLGLSYGDVATSTLAALNQSQKLLPTTHQLHASQTAMPTSLSILQQSNMTLQPPDLNQSQLQGDRQSEHLNGLYPSVQQIRPMREPMQTTRSMLNIESHQQSSQHRACVCPSFLDPEIINAADKELLIAQYHLARKMYLPHFMYFEKRAAEEHANKARNVNQRQLARRMKISYQQSIKHLSVSDWDLTRTPIELLRYYINKSTAVLKKVYDDLSTISAGCQVPQFPNRNAMSVNYLQNTHTTTLTSTPMICSSTIENGILHSKSEAPNMQPVLHRGPQRTAEQNDHFNPAPMQSASMDQPVKRVHSKKPQRPPEKKDFMDSMFLPMNTKATLKNSQGQTSRAHPKIPRVPKRNTSVSNPMEIIQPKPLIVDIDSPATRGTSSSVPKQIKNSAKSVSLHEFGASKAHSETDKSVMLGTPGALTSTLPSNSSSPESNRLSESAKQPIDHLTQVLQSVSKEALQKSMVDIESVINDMDKLPKYATNDEYEVRTSKKLKRDIDYISRDISTSLDNQRIRNVSNHDLVLKEVREVNRRLLETRVEVASGSSEGTIIRCIYEVMATSYESKRQSPLTTLSADFLVPLDYPELPPKLLDEGLSHGYSLENEDLVERAKSIFEGIMSIGEIAKAWDDYARQALCRGGKNFSSKFGAWREVPAAW